MSPRPTRLLATLSALALGTVAAPALAESVPVRVDRDACSNVVAHVPDTDVAYQPGVDVHGRSVAPADLPGSNSLELPDSFVITLELDLRRSDIPVPGPKSLDPKLQLGLITVVGNRVYYNGQPLDDPDQLRLAAACREFLKRRH
ncbi:MAG TPA: hypothetical protein VMV26_15565 [Alphaproteobacteria bacterium]|nr:hypothetical protein [Alphaproteobacteria bacterium]